MTRLCRVPGICWSDICACKWLMVFVIFSFIHNGTICHVSDNVISQMIFYNNSAISRSQIGRELWSIR